MIWNARLNIDIKFGVPWKAVNHKVFVVYWTRTYLCNIAIASLVFIWSKPKVNEKRRESSFMPQKADVERSTLKPSSDNISLNNYKWKQQKNTFYYLVKGRFTDFNFFFFFYF